MTDWTIILCEGAHDQAALVSLAAVCGEWELMKEIPRSLPKGLEPTIVVPKQDKWGGWVFQRQPAYLSRRNRVLVVRSLGSDNKVLGEAAIDFLGQIRPGAVGVVVDANDSGVDRRQESFRKRYKALYHHADDVRAGEVSGNKPRLGLWVAPNNKTNGKMDDILLKAAKRNHKELTGRGKRFITSLETIESGKWFPSRNNRNKAILGAVNQAVRPGASLAAALHGSNCWFDAGLAAVAPFKQLAAFVETLTSSS